MRKTLSGFDFLGEPEGIERLGDFGEIYAANCTNNGSYPGGWIETPTSIEDKDGAISVLQEPEKLFPQPSKEY